MLPTEQEPTGTIMPELLIQFGKAGYVGRFTSAVEPPARGTLAVVQTSRGLELGTVLGPIAPRFVEQMDASSGGEFLRVAQQADRLAHDAAVQRGEEIWQAADRAGQPVTFLDCEVMLDQRGAVLHAVPWEDCDLDALLADLSEKFQLAVRLLNISQTPTRTDPPEPKTSCGKPDCGTGSGGGCSTGGCGTGGGCSSGSCSRGSVKSAEDLTEYFSNLRKNLENSARTPLN
jgi:hypothetical protein